MTPTKEEFITKILAEQEKRKKAQIKARKKADIVFCGYVKERMTANYRRKRNNGSGLRGAALQ